MVRAVVIRTDDSYALRVPTRFIKDNLLQVGDMVTIQEPLILQQNALAALVRHAKERGPVGAGMGPAQRQRELRYPGGVRNGVAHGAAQQ